MGYPTAPASFTTKNAGETIQPAHVNDLQTEVTAVETGLLNGLQHALTISTGGLTVSTGGVNLAGPSSLATLQVNNGSTFAGPVTFSSGVTFSTNLTIAQNVQFNGASSFAGITTLQVPTLSLSLSADFQVASATHSSPNWNVEDWSVGGMHSTSANSSRITFAHSTGLYQVGASIEFNNPGSGQYRAVRIRYNDTSAVCGDISVGDVGTASTMGAVITGMVRAQSTADYVTLMYFNSGSTSRILANSTLLGTRFWAMKVSN